MKKTIVTTTINAPTEALIAYSRMPGWDLIVVGDLKTPHDLYKDIKCRYLTPNMQDELYPVLSSLLGWNNIQRRNIGFIEAYNLGADIIATVDDDNIPYPYWGEEIFLYDPNFSLKSFENIAGVFDPFSATSNYNHLWHRGYPLQLLNKKNFIKESKIMRGFSVQANFWDSNPDVDAICRMEHDPVCSFNDNDFPVCSPNPSPFNSQNTMITREAIKDYFMFPFVGRMDDIWGGYYLQAVGHKVVYGDATVHQERNPHNLTKDFEHEVIGYVNTLALIKDLENDPENMQKYVPAKSWLAFQTYRKLFI